MPTGDRVVCSRSVILCQEIAVGAGGKTGKTTALRALTATLHAPMCGSPPPQIPIAATTDDRDARAANWRSVEYNERSDET